MADFACCMGGQFELPATKCFIGFCMKDELFISGAERESDYEVD
ncbi:hypothetical protein [Agrobacterium pusense]|nr:hypothetical protein [Agrobacterium pusense]